MCSIDVPLFSGLSAIFVYPIFNFAEILGITGLGRFYVGIRSKSSQRLRKSLMIYFRTCDNVLIINIRLATWFLLGNNSNLIFNFQILNISFDHPRHFHIQPQLDSSSLSRIITDKVRVEF